MSSTRHHHPCSSSSCRYWMVRLPSSGEPLGVSTTLPYPTRSLPGRAGLARRRPRYAMPVSIRLVMVMGNPSDADSEIWRHTFFLNCLWIASSASFIVTPFRFRAVTSSPRGKCRSIFLTGGVVRSFLSASLSSTVDGDVFNFLQGDVSGHYARGS